MRRRSGVTLIEVLVAIFIAGIGMLALLVLFPLGAVSMAQALRDDRTSSAAAIAENIALAFDIRHDPLVAAQFTAGASPWPSNPVYADPWGASVLAGSVPGANGTSIPRVNLSFLATVQGGPERWCTFLDDITFSEQFHNGTADLQTSFLERAGWYTWAYMLQRPNAATDAIVNLSVVVYQKRPVPPLPIPPTMSVNEYPYSAAGTAGTNAVTLTWQTATQPQPAIRRNSWLLDTSNATIGVVHSDFYRVVNVTEIGSATPGTDAVVVELEQNLKYNTDSMTVMQDVVDVFVRGSGWQP